MMTSQQTDREFYEQQNAWLLKRFTPVLEQWEIDAESYFAGVNTFLENSPLWLWEFLCGLQDTLREARPKKSKVRQAYIEAETERRLWNIKRTFHQGREYVKYMNWSEEGK